MCDIWLGCKPFAITQRFQSVREDFIVNNLPIYEHCPKVPQKIAGKTEGVEIANFGTFQKIPNFWLTKDCEITDNPE